MTTRRTLSLLAALALVAPMAATASAACEPGSMAPHCPMMGALADAAPPCHGTAIQADDCCPQMAAAEPAAGVPAVAAAAGEAAVATPAPPADAAPVGLGATRCSGRSTPLYRLFRALLI